MSEVMAVLLERQVVQQDLPNMSFELVGKIHIGNPHPLTLTPLTPITAAAMHSA